MKTIKMLGLAVMAVLALGAVSATAASATVFEGPGGEAQAKAVTSQAFTANGNVVLCDELSTKSVLGAGPTESEVVTIQYENCVVKTESGFEVASATVLPAEYLFMTNKSVSVLKPIVIHVSSLLGSCDITVQEQLIDNAVTYENKAPGINVVANASGIAFTTSGGVCGEAGTATYTGTSYVQLVSGATIEVK